MSWTDSDTIKKHLLDLDRLPTEYREVSVDLNASGVGTLPHKGIVITSEKVKRVASLDPTSQSGVGLTAETWATLSYTDLVPDRMIVAGISLLKARRAHEERKL